MNSQAVSNFSFRSYFNELVRPLAKGIKAIRLDRDRAKEASENTTCKETKRLAYEINQTLGVKGFVLNFAQSASLTKHFPACWDAVRSCLETAEFEDAAGNLYAEASCLAGILGEINQKSSLQLSRDEALHLQAGLDFYHFLLPKILVLTSAFRQACEQEIINRGIIEEIALGKEADACDGPQHLFQHLRSILSISPVPGSVKAPQAWSKYWAEASDHLKPVVQGENYRRASNRLYEISRQLGLNLRSQISAMDLDDSALGFLTKNIRRIETLLPLLIINITLLQLYWRPAERFATAATPAPAQVSSGAAPKRAKKRDPKYQPVMGASPSQFVPA